MLHGYILSIIHECTHLKLEKLVYMCYAEYLCEYKASLFKDRIYAYKFGPVVKSVYDKYKKYGYRAIDEKAIKIDILEMPARSRILFAENGIEKLKTIDKTLESYGKYSASDLVTITHKEMTPWSFTGKGLLRDKVITNDTILKYHCNEKI